MKNEIYKNCKSILIDTAKEAKRHNKTDKPYIRQCINEQADQLHRQIDFHEIKETISQKQANLYKLWITNLTPNTFI